MDVQFMRKAVELAVQNVQNGGGGPFGAVIVKNGKIVGSGCNNVTTQNDPTAHAEVQAIRDACKNLNSFQLDDCEIYTSCEPCPMCLGAIYWARPKAVYYACTKTDAANIGFDDAFIYEQLELPMEKRSVPFKQILFDNHIQPFTAWTSTQNKVEY